MHKLFVFIFCFVFLSAVCWAGGRMDQSSNTNVTSGSATIGQPPLNTYFIGEGGKGTSLTILSLRATGLTDDQNHIPAFVQGELVNNFTTYTAFSVLDRERLDDQYAELLSGYYDDNAEAGMDLGHLRPADYIMHGSITRTTIGYALHIFVTRTADKMTTASYSETCTVAELNNLTGVRRASLNLLQKMGVIPTELALNELSRAGTSNEITAQTALAMSVTAATDFEKMLYTYQANQLDPTLAEAARRVAAYRTEIYQAPGITIAMPDIKIPEIRAPEFQAPEIRMAATGNIGADARRQVEQYNEQKEVSRIRQESGNRAVKNLQDAFLNQFMVQSEAVKTQQTDLIRQRNILLDQQKTLLERQRQMIAQLREAEDSYDVFFSEHPPFQIIYDPMVKPVGDADLAKGTINMEFTITIVGTRAMEVIPLMLADFEKGLETISRGLQQINVEFDKIQSLLGQVEDSGRKALAQLVNNYATQVARVEASERSYATQLANLDTELKTTGYAQLGRDYAVRVDANYAERLAAQYAVQSMGYSATRDKTTGSTWSLSRWNKDGSRTFVIEAWLENDLRKTIGTATVNLTNQIFAAAYTKPLSASISCVFHSVLVNDITDTLKVVIKQVNNRDVTVAANAGYIKISPLEANGYTKDGWDIYGFGKNGYDIFGYGKDGYDKEGYYKDGYNRNGYDRNGLNRIGQTKKEVAQQERERRQMQRERRQMQIDRLWGNGYLGFFIGGQFNIQPSGWLVDFGLEAGGKWFVVDFGSGWGNGSLKVNDEMVENHFGSIDWGGQHIFSPRIGMAIPINFQRARLNIGGGFEWLGIFIEEDKGEKINSEGKEVKVVKPRSLDFLFTPYVGARLDVALTKYGGLLWFLGYRCEFTPTDKMGTYFDDSSSLRHTIFSGFNIRFIFSRLREWTREK